MASVFVQFVANQGLPFQFSPILNGSVYTCKITWNNFGLRWYLNVYDGQGNLTLSTALNSTPAAIQSQFNWTANGQLAVAVCNTPHNVRIGAVVNARVTDTGTPLDNDWQVQAIDRYSLQWQIPQPVNPTSLFQGNVQFPAPISPASDENQNMGYYLINPSLSGYVSFIQNLVAGNNLGWLLYHADIQQFEYDDGT